MTKSMASKRSSFVMNACLVVVSTFLALVCLEITLRIFSPGAPKRTAPQVRYIHVDHNANTGMGVAYHYLAPLQRGYHYEAAVETSSLGLRNPEVAIPKPNGVFRIVALGDSHTFGYAVNNEDTWPRRLEAKIQESHNTKTSKWEVVNAGIEALSLEQEVQFFKDRLTALQPDLLLIGYYWNDMPMQGDPFEPVTTPHKSEQVGVSTVEAKPTPAAPGVLSRSIDWAKDLMRQSYLLYAIVQRVPYLQMRLFPAVETMWKNASLQGRTSGKIEASWSFVEDKLKELKNLGKEKGFEVIVVIIPLFEQMTSDGYPHAVYQSRLSEICQSNSIEVIDPLEAIRAINPTYPAHFIPFDGHPNGAIYRVIADVIYQRLNERLRSSRGYRPPAPYAWLGSQTYGREKRNLARVDSVH